METLRKDLVVALKSHDSVSVETLRMLLSALDGESKRQGDFNDEKQLQILRTEAKKRQEAIEIYKNAGEEERAKGEEAELEVIKRYLPAMMSEDEVRKVVEEMVAGGVTNKGQLIGQIIGRIGKDKVDGQIVSRLVNEIVK